MRANVVDLTDEMSRNTQVVHKADHLDCLIAGGVYSRIHLIQVHICCIFQDLTHAVTLIVQVVLGDGNCVVQHGWVTDESRQLFNDVRLSIGAPVQQQFPDSYTYISMQQHDLMHWEVLN